MSRLKNLTCLSYPSTQLNSKPTIPTLNRWAEKMVKRYGKYQGPITSSIEMKNKITTECQEAFAPFINSNKTVKTLLAIFKDISIKKEFPYKKIQ